MDKDEYFSYIYKASDCSDEDSDVRVLTLAHASYATLVKLLSLSQILIFQLHIGLFYLPGEFQIRGTVKDLGIDSSLTFDTIAAVVNI